MSQGCRVEGCEKQVSAKGFCNTHYRQVKRGQRSPDGHLLRDVNPKRPAGTPPPPCSVEGCERPCEGRKFCNTHKTQVRLGILDAEGEPLRELKTKRGTRRTVTPKGYVKVYEPEHERADSNGYVREHIVVIERELERALLPGELVHHINGIRDDNRPENLELRTTATHEPGHCPDVSIAVETLRRSREEWDRGVLQSLLVGVVDVARLLGQPPNPTGGLKFVPEYKGTRRGPRCSVDGCGRPLFQTGVCTMHYHRQRRGEPPEGLNKHGLPHGFIRNAAGYILVKLPGHPCAMANGYAQVHRVVVSNYLNRPLESGEVVHHRNGNREDNRLQNLQLMSVSENARGYCRRPEDALKLLTVTWPAGEAYRAELEALL